LRRALRQNPDVILVGEMRDLDTMRIALTAAETGHLVMATLHTSSAYSTVTRIVDAFPTDQQEMVRAQLAGALNLVICQQLLEKVGGGRVPAYEIMKVNSGIRNLIRENKIQQIPSAIQISGNDGNNLLDDHLFRLFVAGTISETNMMDRCEDPKNLSLKVQNWKAEQEALALKNRKKMDRDLPSGISGRLKSV
ncbi:MAG: Flp pilus assembly complex ATPase component TadA, partial [Planctomycetes bacterium]|nr:Flp pilus assembly complex ATPase component TadA [Planctomycetota bacterium]